EGELVLELSKGRDRFQARWDLATGTCALWRHSDRKEEKLDSKETSLKKPGKYRLRFANVDERLAVWVDSSMPFGDGHDYRPPGWRGPTENDLEPASIGASGVAGLAISGLKLWRDTYYTANLRRVPDAGQSIDYSRPADWTVLNDLRPLTMYVQPNHFLCLGDNSPESSDGRSWGL